MGTPSTAFRLKGPVSRREALRSLYITVLAAASGIVSGGVAYLLYYLIAVTGNAVFFRTYDPRHLATMQDNHFGAWIVVIPAVGGLIVGLMAKYGTDKIKGHGIPEAMEAVLTNQSRISARVAVLKPLSAVIAIGTGGPFGAEGPIIQTGGALGSLLGQFVKTSAAERKVLLACGASAGMAAIFGTPIAAVLISIELLLFEFRVRSFIQLVVASTVATVVRHRLLGSGPLFHVHSVPFGIPDTIPYYVLLGVICGLFAAGFSKALFWVEDQFGKLPFDSLWHPALGALMLGGIAYFVPRVLGVGYDVITAILNDQFTLRILLLILVFKSLALLVSLGSGTSGGLLAPMFMSGAALGGAFALIVNTFVPGAHLAPGAFALVGMAALFGSAARAPFTLLVFAFEITRDYDAVLPLMLVTVVATGVTMLVMRRTIMTEKLERRGLRVPSDYVIDPLKSVAVEEVMEPQPATVSESATLGDLARRFALVTPTEKPSHAFPVLTETGQLVGIVTRGDVLRALGDEPSTTSAPVGRFCSRNLVLAHPDEPVRDALDLMLRHEIGRLPVVDPMDPGRLRGYLGRSGIMRAHGIRRREETLREGGMFGSRPAGRGPKPVRLSREPRR